MGMWDSHLPLNVALQSQGRDLGKWEVVIRHGDYSAKVDRWGLCNATQYLYRYRIKVSWELGVRGSGGRWDECHSQTRCKCLEVTDGCFLDRSDELLYFGTNQLVFFLSILPLVPEASPRTLCFLIPFRFLLQTGRKMYWWKLEGWTNKPMLLFCLAFFGKQGKGN